MWEKVTVPFLSAANWGGQGLHPRGNFEGFVRAASKHKWLEAHGIEHWTHFYTDYGVKLQKRFFDYFLKGEDNGWDTPAARAAAGAPRRRLRRAARGRVADRAHAVDAASTSIPPSQVSAASRRLRRRTSSYDAAR